MYIYKSEPVSPTNIIPTTPSNMLAVVYEKPFSVAIRDVPKPKIEHPDDVIVKSTSSIPFPVDRFITRP